MLSLSKVVVSTANQLCEKEPVVVVALGNQGCGGRMHGAELPSKPFVGRRDVLYSRQKAFVCEQQGRVSIVLISTAVSSCGPGDCLELR